MNKAKILKSAEKHLMQGKIPAAISDYQKIIETDPNDFAVLNTIGDLYVRLGNLGEGLRYFNNLASSFYSGGFKVKAIAIYKKITKLAPSSMEARQRLAELYALQGLLSEARAQYLQLADAFVAEGKLDQAAESLRKLAAAEPGNTEVQSRLIDVEVKRGNAQTAVGMMLAQAERLRQKGDVTAAKATMEKAQKIDADSPAVKILLAKILVAEGQTDPAIALLHELDTTGSSPEVQLALWECLLGANRLDEAAQVGQRLFESDARHFPLLLTLSERYLASGEMDAAVRILDPLVQAPRLEPYGMRLSGLLQKILSENPDHLPAIERSVTVSRKLGQINLISLALEHLASYHIKNENFPTALSVYKELLEVDPLNAVVRQGMGQLQRQLGEPVEKEASSEEGIHPSEPKPDERQAFDASSVQEFALEEKKPYPRAATEKVKEVSAEDVAQRELLDSLVLEGELLAGYGLVKRAAQVFEELVRISPYHALALRRLVEIYSSLDQLADAARCCAKLSKVAYKEGQVDEARQWTRKAADLDQTVQSKPIAEAPELSPGLDRRRADWSGQMGAEDRYDLSDELMAVSESSSRGKDDNLAPGGAAASAASADEAVLIEAIEEIDFYIDQKFWAEAQGLVEKMLKDFPDSEVLKARLEQCRALAPPLPPMEETVPAALPATEPVAEPTDAVLTVATQGFGDVLSEFNVMESTSDAGGDFNTHYNLGIAFREMGLIEEAVAEVQKALSLIDPEDRKQDYFNGCSLLGLCLAESQRYQEAVEWMGRGLSLLGGEQKGEEVLSLKSDLADTCAKAGNLQRSRKLLEEIRQENPNFRDVEQRIQALPPVEPGN